jgi:ATP-dependent DNA helicase RecG
MSRHRAEVEAALEGILAGGRPADFESPTLDFKEDRAGSLGDTEKMLAEAVICFANAGGGTVVLGVRDKATGPEALVGTALSLERLQERVYHLTNPPIAVSAEPHPRHPSVLLVSVAQSADVHADTRGRATRRIGLGCEPMSPAQIAALVSERRGVDHSAAASLRAIDEVSPEAIAMARRMLARFADERRQLAGASVPDLLAGVGACAAHGALNVAGELMFCPPAPGAPAAVLYQYRPTPGGEPRLVQRLDAPLVLAFNRTMELVEARSEAVPLTLRDGQQFAVEDFPRDAVREALSNALCHRDLRILEPVTVEHSPTVMRIVSPGPLMTGITPNNIITTPSRPRNRALMSVARTLGLAEEVGRGVDRIYRAMIGSGRDLPRIEEDAERVSVTLVGGAPNMQVARFVAQLPHDERDDTDTLLLLFHLCRHRTVTALTLAPWLQKTDGEAVAILRRLASGEAAMIESTRATAMRSAPTYRLRSEVLRALGAAVVYNRRTGDEIDRKVIAHVREYGKITNNTLKNLFDIDVYKARDIIADLARREILVRTSESQRGPGVTWGAGPKFPATRSRAPRTPAPR